MAAILPGCPQTWDEAYGIEEKFNEGKEYNEPRWDFDCGFKLDFDGPLLRVSSRFYPPKTHYGATWDGSVTIFLMGDAIAQKTFDCATLDELKSQVDEYIARIKASVSQIKL